VCALLYGVQAQQRSLGVDYYQFWVMSDAASGPARDTLYTIETSRRIGLEYLARGRALPEPSRFRTAAEWNERTNPDLLDPISTPFYYAAIGALATGDYDRDLLVHQTLGSLAFVAALLGLCRAFGYAWPAALLAATLTLLWFGPLQSDVQAANVNRLQFAGTVLALLLLRRGGARDVFLAGFVLALLCAYKPNLALVPVLLAAAWAVQSCWRELQLGGAGLVSGSALAFLCGAWLFGTPRAWLDWIGVSQKVLAKPYPIENFNVSLATLVHSSTGVNVSLWLALSILAGYGACLWLGRARADARESAAARCFAQDVLAVGTACLLPLVAAQIAWDHYFVLTLPLVLYFLRPDAALAERLVAVVALLLVAQAPLNVVLPLDGARQVALAFAIGSIALLALTLRRVARA
jgi:hypothetical protein